MSRMKQNVLGLAVVFSLLAFSAHARADGPAPVVHVDAASDIVLERVDGDGHTTPVCRAPCDTSLDAHREYQLSGEGLRSSNRFVFPEAPAATIKVEGRSSRGFIAGIVLLTISGVLATGGFFLLGAMVASDNSGGFAGGIGGAFAGIGAIFCGTASIATAVPGILLLTNNIQSRAKILEGDRLATQPVAPRPTMIPLLERSF